MTLANTASPPLEPTRDSTRCRRQERDASLLREIEMRNPDALGELYDLYASSILGFLMQLLGRREEAEEVLQEAMLQVWRQAAKYDPRRASVASWLSMIARSRAIDRYRSTKGHDRTLANVEREPGSSTVDPRGTHNVWLHELRRRLRTALEQLPAAQRDVIHAMYFRGLTHVETAEALDTPLGTIKTRALLAMRKLRRNSGIHELL